MYDYAALEARIKDKFHSKERFADRLGIGRTSLYHKLTGQSQFKQDEMIKAIKLLEVDEKELSVYFFTPFV